MSNLLARVGTALVSGIAVVVLAACAEGPAPTGLELQPIGFTGEGRVAPDLSALAKFSASAGSGVRYSSSSSSTSYGKTIGAKGGRLEFNGFAIQVPAGAVGSNTQFTITLPSDASSARYVVAEFGPHNVRFAAPITIELPYAGTTADGSQATVLWWNEGAASWVDMGASRSADGARILTSTGHFSVYGAAERNPFATGAGG